VLGPDGVTPDDPLNLVVIGEGPLALLPFTRRGWYVTETISGGAVWHTVVSSLFKARYRTSPISPLYLFGLRPGVGAATRTTPRFDYTGDPYRTDGRRVVLVLSTTEVLWEDLVNIDWEDLSPQPR
jgi:LssY C-terminus